MSLFRTPEEHAANPPETWRVVKVADRCWELQTSAGVGFESKPTRRAAEELKVSGFYVRLYEKDRRWYAGETPPGHKSWAQCLAEQERWGTDIGLLAYDIAWLPPSTGPHLLDWRTNEVRRPGDAGYPAALAERQEWQHARAARIRARKAERAA